jgi:hypothetical protein
VVTEIQKRRSVTTSTERSVSDREGGDTCVFPHCHHVTIRRVRSTNCFGRHHADSLGSVTPPPESIYFSFVFITYLGGDKGDNKRNSRSVTASGQKRHTRDNEQIFECHHLHAVFRGGDRLFHQNAEVGTR